MKESRATNILDTHAPHLSSPTRPDENVLVEESLHVRDEPVALVGGEDVLRRDQQFLSQMRHLVRTQRQQTQHPTHLQNKEKWEKLLI